MLGIIRILFTIFYVHLNKFWGSGTFRGTREQGLKRDDENHIKNY